MRRDFRGVTGGIVRVGGGLGGGGWREGNGVEEGIAYFGFGLWIALQNIGVLKYPGGRWFEGG